MQELKGRVVKRVLVGPAEHVLVFETDQGPISYETYGDCCSETWFADIVGVKELIGATVKDVEDIPLHENCLFEEYSQDGRSRQESDAFYGVRLITTRGDTNIIYRNSSNGYYGGSISASTQRAGDDFKVIEDDWQA